MKKNKDIWVKDKNKENSSNFFKAENSHLILIMGLIALVLVFMVGGNTSGIVMSERLIMNNGPMEEPEDPMQVLLESISYQINMSMEELKILIDHTDKLSKENSNLTKKVDLLQNQNDEMAVEIMDLMALLEDTGDIEQLEEQVSSLSSELSSTQSSLDQCQSNLQRIRNAIG